MSRALDAMSRESALLESGSLESGLPAAVGPDPADLLWVGARPADDRGRVVVEVVGAVDDYTVPLLASCLRGQSARSAVRTLVVDLSRARALTGAGVSALEEAAEQCASRGARLLLRTRGQGGSAGRSPRGSALRPGRPPR